MFVTAVLLMCYATNAPQAVVHIQTASADVVLHVELARDQAAWAQGLMHRQKLDNHTGMLFIFNHVAPRNFWMKNTYIPLDIFFIDAQQLVVNIAYNTVPLTETSIKSVKPVQFVLETAAGFANNYAIHIGDKVTWQLDEKKL